MTYRLIGGEMLVWSDLDGTHGPGPVRGEALAPFLAAARGRTLVAGPHDPALLAGLTGATVLVRGVPDAERLAGLPGLEVLCGSVAKLAAEEPFDTVIALDGLERLGTAEHDELSWAQTLDVLRGVLKPDGLLMLALENPLGVHRLVAPPRPPSDSDWTPAWDDTRPAGPGPLTGSGASRVYALYPDPVRPRVVLETTRDDAAAEAVVAGAFDDDAEVLTDPVPPALASLRQGHVLAPAWVVVAARTRDALRTPATAPGAAPGTRTLLSRIAGAAARRDLPAVRELLGSWLDGPAAGVPAGQVLSGPDGTLTPLAPAGDVAATLRDLADRLQRGGHPWPGSTDLAATLAAMAGRELAIGEETERRALPFAELRAERDRLTRELAEARAQAAFLAEELTAREADLRLARRTVELLSGTGPARAGRAFVGGVRAARRLLRRP
ncbi:hypothetical protein [Nucisporomicrobium flavum]|uniref:hypothetical protein n=1 Tax=Nucisporomicrobium flavum TaxID=2785915 RepID=UPI0018F44674|nr:hypothetical protein [Nucisporomicrobium flavum]